MEGVLSSALASGASVSFIDVGKGDCILVQAGGSAVLIDTGYDETSGRVASHLRRQGVGRLDCVIITHYDGDHVGGMRAIAESVDIGAVYLPGYAGSDKNYRLLMAAIGDVGLDAKQVMAPLQLALGDASLTLFPSSVAYIPGGKGDEGNDNDVSLVATLACGGDSFLFAGDLEKDGIEAFLRAGHGRFDVLKVPHHGNKCALTDELIESVGPQIAVVTDSSHDPADRKTVKLLEEAGADVFCTSTSGTIVVRSDGAGHYAVAEHA